MPRITASRHGEAKLRMLRLVRQGDRHDPRSLTVSCEFEGDFSAAFLDGRATGLPPGETIKSLVHSVTREHGAGEVETLGLALCAQILARQPRISLARVEIAEERWQRLEAGGKPQPQAFVGGSGEQRTVVVTGNGQRVSVVAGIAGLALMRTAGFSSAAPSRDDGVQRLLAGDLSARWTYTSGDVAFGPCRQGVRAAILDTAAWHASRSVQHALYTAAGVILSSYDEIADVTLSFRERPYRPADRFASDPESADDLFVVIDEPVGVVEVTVERT